VLLKKLLLKKEKEKKFTDISNISAQINKRTSKDELLRSVHTLLLGRVNKKVNVKANLKEFSGLVYDDDHTREKFEQKLERHKLRELRDVARLFGQDDKGEKEDLVKAITDFLEKPKESDRSYSSSPKKATKKKSSSSSKKSSSGKKATTKKSSSSSKKSSTKKTGEKKKRKKKDPNAPKNALSAYMFFCQEHREEAKKSIGSGASITDVAKKLGKMWKKVDSEDKKKFEKKHQKDKERYEKEMKKYKKKDSKGSGSDKE